MKRNIRPLCDAYLNFVLKLSLATTIDVTQYADWLRANAPAVAAGFDQWLRHNEGNIHPSEQITEMSIYGRMQFSRAMGLGV